MEDRHVGVLLALSSTVFSGSSFVLKKMGLITSEGHGACRVSALLLLLADAVVCRDSVVVRVSAQPGLVGRDHHEYAGGRGVPGDQPNPCVVWRTVGLAEFTNFAAYTFAPAILVTPLGALSVAISAVLAAVFLNERLDRAGKIGCGLCMVGSTVIVLHAPPEKHVASVNEFVHYIMQPRACNAHKLCARTGARR
jgi:drug/metabolite transporter (DMT)-like permease